MILAQMRLTDLIEDARCQMRVSFSEAYAQELAEYLEAGGSLPPVIAFRERPGKAQLADGWHRKRARELHGERMIEVSILPGGLRDAILYATGCNARSPLRPKPEDFRKAVSTLLLDAEWGKWSNRHISEHCGVGEKMIRRLREYLADLSASRPQIEQGGITCERHGTVYVQAFRDMTPAQQKQAVQAETDDARPVWRRLLEEATANQARLIVDLGESHAALVPIAREFAAELRRIDKRLA